MPTGAAMAAGNSGGKVDKPNSGGGSMGGSRGNVGGQSGGVGSGNQNRAGGDGPRGGLRNAGQRTGAPVGASNNAFAAGANTVSKPTISRPDVTKVGGATGTPGAQGPAKGMGDNVSKMADQDYRGMGDTSLDTIGNIIASAFGVNERNPFTDPAYTGGPNANWGGDAMSMLAGGAGMALGVPGIGILADLVSRALGRPMDINLGPAVFGSPTGPSTPSNDLSSLMQAGQAINPFSRNFAGGIYGNMSNPFAGMTMGAQAANTGNPFAGAVQGGPRVEGAPRSFDPARPRVPGQQPPVLPPTVPPTYPGGSF